MFVVVGCLSFVAACLFLCLFAVSCCLLTILHHRCTKPHALPSRDVFRAVTVPPPVHHGVAQLVLVGRAELPVVGLAVEAAKHLVSGGEKNGKEEQCW